MKKLFTTILCIIVLSHVANAATYYVKIDGTDGANAGTSWSTAFATISYAETKATTAGDNIYVKAGNYTTLSSSTAGGSAWATKANVNYYGGFLGASDAETPATRATSDLDNNGITEPWEFTNATVITINATNNAYGLNITSNTAKRVFDGFTITGTLNVGQLSASTGGNNMVKINNFTSFQNNTLSGCTLSAAPNTATANMGYTKGALIFMGQPTTTTGGSNTVDNCLIENNTSKVTPTSSQTQDVQQSPFVHIDASNTTGRNVFSNCIIRKNLITLDYTSFGMSTPTYNNPRGMIISISSGTTYNNCMKNLVVHNNSVTFIPYGGTGTTNLGNGGLIYTYNSATTNMDSIVNCTVANNSMMRIGYAIRGGFSNTTQPYHVISNNVLLDNKNNNGSGTITAQNLIINQVPAGSAGTITIANNISNAGFSATTNVNNVFGNINDLSSTNINAKGSYFTSPTSLIGYSTDASVATSKWTIDNGSYLTGKGISTSNKYDKAGVTFTAIPTVGAYETTKPVITWTQTALNLLSNQSPVTLTAASSTVTPSSTPAASAISYASDNSAVVSVNGNVLTVVGVGTANIIASQPANNYYNAATSVSKSVTVTQNGYRGAVLSNGTFELGTDASTNVSWWQKTGTAANFTYTIDNTSQITGSNSAKLSVTTTGLATQCALFQYLTLPKPSIYTVSFKAKASTACTIQAALVQSYQPFGWISGGSASFNLTTSTQTFSYDITTTSTTGLCKFAFYFGDVLTDIYLDDITIVEKTPLTNANMCNGDFEATINNAIYAPTNYTYNGISSGTPDATANSLYYGWSLDKLTASTAAMTATTETGVDKITGSQSVKLTSTGTATATSTDLQFAYVFAGVKDKQYNVYFKAKASAATTMGVMLQAWSYSASPSITYLSEQTVNLTTSVQTFGFTTTNPFLQPDGRNILQFLLGKLPNGVSVWIDDVVVQPVQVAVVTPALTWSQSLTGLSVGSSPVSLTASSNYTPASSSAASAITYGSSNTAAITVSGSSLTIVGVGTSNITAYQAADVTGNYSAATTVVQSVTIAKGTPTITVTPVGTYTYNGSPQGPNAVTKGGSTGAVTYSYVGVNGTTYSASATRPTAAGSYTVTASVATDANYNAASSSATAFSIDKATPTITVTPVDTYTYNGSVQGPNAVTKGGSTGAVTYSYVGVNGTTYSASATRPTTAGSYTVTASVATDANYNAASSSATAFSIDKATQTITFNSLPTGKIVGNADFTPGATSATSGTNAITYSSSNTAVATIVSGNIHIIGVGNTTIYADQAFSDNYNAATQVSQSLTVDGQSSISIVVPKTATEILTNPTADVALSSTLTMDEDKTVKNITVSAAGTINLPTSKVLTVNGNLDLKADLTSSFSVNLGSSSISLPTGVVRYLKTIDDTKWYFISFPCNVNIASIKESNGTSLGTLGINWFIKYYNGQRRADNGSDGSNWISITAADLGTTPNLLANKGYIIGLSTNTGVSKEIAFPLDKAILSGEAAKTSIPVSIYNGSATAPNHGWNLVGQPYISKFDVAGAGVPYIYFVKTGGSGYDYYLPTDGTRIENPFGAYFVQSSGNTSVSFDTSSRQSVRSSVATNVSDNLQLNFSSVSGTDRTNIIMDNTMSSAYVIGQDLEKWFGSSAAVYTLLGGINYALNGLPMTSVVNLPLGVYSLNGGAATISASANNAPSLSKLILTDNVLHTTTNLLEKYYPYTATAGTDNTRFQITAQRVVTDVNLTSNELGETQFMITPIAIGAKLMINNLNTNAIVRVYDALGRMLVSKNVTSNVMEIKLNARGIYTVQMQNGATISSRKVIF